MIEGAIILAAGWLAGHVTSRIHLRQRTPKPPPPAKPIKPICGCDHELAYHDPKTGECHASVKVMLESGNPVLDYYGNRVIAYKGAKYEHRQCSCKRYTGPEPLPSYYAPELTS